MPDLPARLRSDLTAAMRDRDRDAARVLRTVLSAIANAEAQPRTDEPMLRLESESRIAGAVEGVGAAEVARRELTEDDVLNLVRAERDERLASAQTLDANGAGEQAEVLRAEARLLERYLS